MHVAIPCFTLQPSFSLHTTVLHTAKQTKQNNKVRTGIKQLFGKLTGGGGGLTAQGPHSQILMMRGGMGGSDRGSYFIPQNNNGNNNININIIILISLIIKLNKIIIKSSSKNNFTNNHIFMNNHLFNTNFLIIILI